jgi:hypothetical protein
MATTTNFGWTTPDDTDLVKDGAAAIRTALGGVDTSFVDLKGGTTGQILTKNSATDLDFVWSSESGDISEVTAGTGLSGGGASGAVTLSINTAVTADLTTSQVLTNKTLTSPEEKMTVTATAATGTVTFDTQAQGVLYYTSDASANFTLDFTNVNSNLTTGNSLSVVFLNTNGATAYYPDAFKIDGTTVTPKWSGGTAPSAGNASSIDAYSFIIIKTANATFTTLAGGAVKFA